jgi:hypothetical protein
METRGLYHEMVLRQMEHDARDATDGRWLMADGEEHAPREVVIESDEN